jgi:hypothetical protein
VKLSGTTGAHIWSRTFGSTGSDYVRGIAVDPSGNVAAVGYGNGAFDLGNGTYVPSAGYSDSFITVYDTNGNFIPSRSRMLVCSNPDLANGVAFDAAGDMYVAGSFSNTIDLGGISKTSAASNFFIAKYLPTGAIQWGISALAVDTNGGSAGALGLALDSNGNAVITGGASGGVDFGGGLGGGYSNFFVAKYGAAAGGYIWAKRSTNDGLSGAFGIATDGARNVFGTGFTAGTATFDGKTLSTPGTQYKSAYLLKISP